LQNIKACEVYTAHSHLATTVATTKSQKRYIISTTKS